MMLVEILMIAVVVYGLIGTFAGTRVLAGKPLNGVWILWRPFTALLYWLWTKK